MFNHCCTLITCKPTIFTQQKLELRKSESTQTIMLGPSRTYKGYKQQTVQRGTRNLQGTSYTQGIPALNWKTKHNHFRTYQVCIIWSGRGDPWHTHGVRCARCVHMCRAFTKRWLSQNIWQKDTKRPPKAPAVHDAAPFTPAGQGITWPLGWYWYWEESFRSFSRWICPRSDKACCPATPGSHPANCLKTWTLEIVWSKSKYTCFTSASDFSALAAFGSTGTAAAFAIFGTASALKTPLKPSGGGGGALPLAVALQIPLKPVGGGGGTAGLDVAVISFGATVLLALAEASFWAPTMDLNSCSSRAVIPFRSDTKTLRQMPFTEAISAASSSTKAASSVLRPAWDISAWMRFALVSGSWQSGEPSNLDGWLFSWSNSDSP